MDKNKNISDIAIIRPSDAAKLLGVSRSSVYRFVNDGLLTKPIRIGKRASGWRFSTLNDFIQARESGTK